MYLFQVVAQYYVDDGESTQRTTAQYIVYAVNKNDAWLSAVSKLWTLLSGSKGIIDSFIVSNPITPSE